MLEPIKASVLQESIGKPSPAESLEKRFERKNALKDKDKQEPVQKGSCMATVASSSKSLGWLLLLWLHSKFRSR